jgi:hypothetical protein
MSTCKVYWITCLAPLGQRNQFEGAKHDWTSPTCVTRLDRDRAAGVNPAGIVGLGVEIKALPYLWHGGDAPSADLER